MNHFAMVNRKGTLSHRSSGKSRTTDSAFDRWLNRGLHELFDDVIKEPIPEQFLEILRRTAPPDLGAPRAAEPGDAAPNTTPKTGKAADSGLASRKPKPDRTP